MKTLSKITGTTNKVQNLIVLFFGLLIVLTLSLLVNHVLTIPGALASASF